MDCKTCEQQLNEYLSAVPSKWRDQLVGVLCDIKLDKQKPDCESVTDCETLTTLSDFSIEGTVASITYTDENSVSYTRSFDIALVLNNLINETDPNCLATEEDWLNLSFSEKIQLLIDAECENCPDGVDVSIPFTANDTGLSCRYITSSTDPIPDNDPTFNHFIKFVGQDSQDTVYVDIPLIEDEGGWFVPASGDITIPSAMSGDYKIVLFLMTGQDYPGITLYDLDNNILATASSGNGPSSVSDTFNIGSLDHIIFSCQNSG